MHELMQDLKQSLRLIRKSPVFACAIILSIGLGVGANTAIFSVANMVLLRPLPFPESHELMRVHSYRNVPGKDPQRVSMSEQSVYELRQQSDKLEAVAAWYYTSFNLVGSDEPIQVYGSLASSNAFSIFGEEPIIGRTFAPEEDLPSQRAYVVVLSYNLWQNSFGSDPDVLGETLKLNDEVYTIIGVMPPLFEYPYKSSVWIPMGLDPNGSLPISGGVHVVARLADDVDLDEGMEEMDVISARLAQDYPDIYKDWTFGLISVREDLTRDLHSKKMIFLLLGGAAFLLLIACANVANLLIGRSLELQNEIAIRSALGSSRKRLVRQLVTQGLFFAFLGGVVGLIMAYWTIKPLVALNPTEDLNILYLDIHLDHRVLLFSFLVTVVVGVMFSLIPALRVSRPNLQGLLMEGNRTSTSRTGRHMVRALVVAEMAVAVILLVGAGLMLKSLGKLSSIDPGYDLENLMVMRITPLEAKYPEPEQEIDFLERITERAESIPGVQHVAINSLFANRIAVYLAPAIAEGRDPENPDSRILTNHRVVSPGLLDAMGIPLISGRPIDERDQADSEQVVMISETFAKNIFPGENPIDKRVKIDARSRDFPFMRVVGVVGDVLDNGDYENTWYLPYTQSVNATPYYDIIVRTESEPLAFAQNVREAIWSVDPEQAIAEILTAESLVASEFWEERSSAYMLGMFAVVGLLLSIVGIYGIQSYSVAQQNHEIGVRMVFGAMPEDVVRTTLAQGLKLSLIGLAVGIAGALALTRYMESLLHEVSPTDPLVFVGIVAIALLVAVLANYLPARRATQIDPVEMVRY